MFAAVTLTLTITYEHDPYPFRISLQVKIELSVSVLSKVIILHTYEGRPINKLQNGIILLIFKI